MKILSDANMTNRFAYLSSGSVMVPMTVWMVQMKYFVKIKEGVKSKAKLYIYSVTCQLLVVFLAVFDQFSGRFSKEDNCEIQDFLNSDFWVLGA